MSSIFSSTILQIFLCCATLFSVLSTKHFSSPKRKNLATGSKAVQEASDRKARMVTFYTNGEPFTTGVKVSILPGKDFKTLEQLCCFLTSKSNICHGARYIFSLNGQRIFTLNELEHGQSYVMSGGRHFQQHPYGSFERRCEYSHSKPLHQKVGQFRSDDLRLLRPLSSKYRTFNNNTFNGLPPKKAVSYRDGRIITIVNNKDHSLKSRVLLNLRNPRSFEDLLKDLGSAVRIKNAKRMFTVSGQEVRSVSQLKRDLLDVDLFYLDTNSTISNSLRNVTKSQSLESFTNESPKFNVAHKSMISNTVLNSSKNPHLPRVDSAPDIASPTGSDINPSRRGDSNSSGQNESGRINEFSHESDSLNSVRSSETQTSPDFVRMSRRHAKKLIKLKSQETPKHYQKETALKYVQSNDRLSNKNAFEEENRSKSNTKKGDITSAKSIRNNGQATSNNNDAIQEFAEQLLKETAFKVTTEVQNEIRSRNSRSSAERYSDKERVSRPNDLPNQLETPDAQIDNQQMQVTKNDRDSNNNGKNGSVAEELRAVAGPSPLKQVPFSTDFIRKEEPKTNATELLQQEYMNTLRDGTNIPDKNLRLRWVHGYKGNTKRPNLFVLPSGELLYHVGSIGVVWHPDAYIQRLYTQHDQNIKCMAMKSNSEVIASAQDASKRNPNSIIRIWSAINLKTLSIINKKELGDSILDLEFTQDYLVVINVDQQLNIAIWEWKKGTIVTKTNKPLGKGEIVFGVLLHAHAEDLMITFGENHLCMWERKSDGVYYNRPAIKPNSKFSKTINCVVFLSDDSLLSGDTTGTLTIWAPNESPEGQLDFVVKEVRGHEYPLTALHLMSNNILISGDDEAIVKTWDVNDNQFRLLNAIKLPVTSGSITAISMASQSITESDSVDIYIGTSMNLILRGSALQSTNYTVIFEGHSLGIRGLAADPNENSFYSAALDQKICKWNEKSLIWKTTTQFQCVSAAVHPTGSALASGSVNGTIFILNAQNGNIVSQLPVARVCIGCLSFSPDGDLLAAGCQDGVMYLLPVSESGFAYEKVSVLKGPFPILSLQWSLDGQFILTSVNDSSYQEIILWDLANCRFMRGVSSTEDLFWKDATCSGGEDVRAIWDNPHLEDVVNLSCHCSLSRKYVVSGDEDGRIRLFSYPCQSQKAAFFEHTQGSGGVTEVRFLPSENYLVSSTFDGALFVWELISVSDLNKSINNQQDSENN